MKKIKSAFQTKMPFILPMESIPSARHNSVIMDQVLKKGTDLGYWAREEKNLTAKY